ncbi:hypothetical protein LINGRAHAP2_LOCUS21328 [Linum grandiflorum]
MDYFATSLSNKLMAITMLLVLTIAVTVSEDSHCSSSGPLASGPCKDDYALCVDNVMTVLRDRTPHSEDGSYTSYYPADQPDGGVLGAAYCSDESTFEGCESCLSDAKDWLDQNCASFSGGYYYYDTYCAMSYDQLFG